MTWNIEFGFQFKPNDWSKKFFLNLVAGDPIAAEPQAAQRGPVELGCEKKHGAFASTSKPGAICEKSDNFWRGTIG